MARRQNELYIGSDKLNIEGREIKHPSLIKLYATLNINKTSEEPIDLLGIDLETNHLTAELKLMGFWNGKRYNHYYNANWVESLFNIVRYADHNGLSIAYWNRLDPFVLFKQFLYHLSDEERTLAMAKFGKVSGEWNRKDEEWEMPPVVTVKVGHFEFGIKNVIRSSVQFYYQKEDSKPRTVWAYDIAQLFQDGLEKEALKYKLDYYSKVDKSAHLVDWERFDKDPEYKALVLRSNEYDSRAVYDLGMSIQTQFKEVFKHYPRTLISQGSLARSAIVSVIMNQYGLENLKDMEQSEIAEKMALVTDDLRAIPFINFYDKWADELGGEVLKDMYCMVMEAYSGGQIEAYSYGFTEEAWAIDLVQAYPSEIMKLQDLRNAKMTYGKGEPPHIPNSYCIIRGEINIPEDVDFHPLTVKHPLFESTNVRPVGEFIGSYILEERDFLVEHGATFTNESWYNLETTGELSPLAKVMIILTNMREALRPEGKDYTPKTTSASVYGLSIEAVDTFILEANKILRDGYRSGEFFNPWFATFITGRVRVKMSKAIKEVVKNGGKPILVMTDGFYWKGRFEDLPTDLWREKKTVQFFEKPEKVKNLICLGSGRYSYLKKNKESGIYDVMVSKNRGLSSAEMLSSDGMDVESFNWLEVAKMIRKTKSTILNITTRKLVSVGMINSNNIVTQWIDGKKVETPISWLDLGRIMEVYVELDVIAGKTKRLYDNSITNPDILTTQLIPTRPVYLARGMDGTDTLNDQSLPRLRELMMMKEVKTAKQKRRKNVARASKRYYDSKGDQVKSYRNQNYDRLRELGYNSYESTKMMGWSAQKLAQKLMEDKKI